ncbi:MAG: NTP transferase domain-containing protein [Spirochaetes bacterium]|nr:NTP transferase domain-containing protein [Spirochaetota bacterium]
MKHPVIIIQARLSSTRLAGKVLREAGGRPMIAWLLERLSFAKCPVVLAVPREDAPRFEPLTREFPVQLFPGSEQDVLDRYAEAARANGADPIIRVTGDNPLTSVECLALCLEKHAAMAADLTHPVGLPYGAGVEVISRQALEAAWTGGRESDDREHVTRYIYKNPGRFEIVPMPVPEAYQGSDLRVTIDTEEDFRRFESIVGHVKPRRYLRLLDAMKFLRQGAAEAPPAVAAGAKKAPKASPTKKTAPPRPKKSK